MQLDTKMYVPGWLTELDFAFSTASDGEMSFKRADTDIVQRNRRHFFSAYNLDLNRMVGAELIHGNGIALVDTNDQGRGALSNDWIEGVDGFATNSPGTLLFTTHADCSPIIVWDAEHRILGQAHAGWRSLSKGIVEKLVNKVRSMNGEAQPSLFAWIGPTVRSCCYPVGSDVSSLFPAECSLLIDNSTRLDMVRFIRLELERLDFLPEQVSDSDICTSCSEEYSSYRRDGLKTTAMALVCGIPSC